MKYFFAWLLVMMALQVFAQDYTTEIIEIWGDGQIPLNRDTIELEEFIDSENKRFLQVSVPVLYLYRKKEVSERGPALLYCPGGGYARVAIGEDRGKSYAELFFEMGFNVVGVLKYRLPDSRIVNQPEKVPLYDAQKALSLFHQNAKAWNIDRKKIGVKGASAGGHLVASLNNWDQKTKAPGVKKSHLKHAFAILRVPVITFNPTYRHSGSYKRLLGEKSTDQELLDYYSMENRVTAKTPPTFLVHAKDDQSVPYQNSVLYAESLEENKIPYQFIQLEKGGHGFGLNQSKTDRDWIPDLKEWIQEMLNN